ncbi:TadE/TadG family type IV pilus assembly protein [Krasilnikovia sp. MM14-A1259]|uniref:TadE/TadG family type IV pilus assembly protein n=1 Tax=Krasilnikovia sp. MM14-A1259 TaxID=3373539 RepID=UPI00380DC41B
MRQTPRIPRCHHRNRWWQRDRARWQQLLSTVRNDDGSAAVETVVVIPSVLLVIFLSLQIAMYSYARSIALGAAQEGLSAARSYDGSAGAGSARARDFIGRAGGDSLSSAGVRVNRGAETATVTVTGNSLSLIPGLRWRVSQTATGPVERFVD